MKEDRKPRTGNETPPESPAPPLDNVLNDRLLTFFEANPYTLKTARQLAIQLGVDMDRVEKELDLLKEKQFIQEIEYPGSPMYRYIPQRR